MHFWAPYSATQTQKSCSGITHPVFPENSSPGYLLTVGYCSIKEDPLKEPLEDEYQRKIFINIMMMAL